MPSAAKSERIEYRRPDTLPGTEILLAEHVARRWRVFHEAYEICTLLDTSNRAIEWRYRGRTYLSHARDTWLLEPGELHANTHVTDRTDFRVVIVEPSVIRRAAEELGLAAAGAPHLKVANLSDRELYRAFLALHASLDTESTALERQSRFASCIRLVLERYTERPPAAPLGQPARSVLRRARGFIEAYYADNITLDQLCTVTGLSRFHLVRAFATEFGLPPHAFQIHLRIAKARGLLATGMPVAAVAAETGFADQSHFTRHFRAVLGVTPGEYAARAARRARVRSV